MALLLSDQRMPGMTGVEFLERAREQYPDARRVLLTAYADTEAAIRAINTARIHYYLNKPWDPPEEKLYPVLTDLLEDWKAGYRPPFEGLRVSEIAGRSMTTAYVTFCLAITYPTVGSTPQRARTRKSSLMNASSSPSICRSSCSGMVLRLPKPILTLWRNALDSVFMRPRSFTTWS